MRIQRLNADYLEILLVFQSILLIKILYAPSACGGYISAENESRQNKVLRKAERYGYTDSVLTFSELLEQSDEQSIILACYLLKPLFVSFAWKRQVSISRLFDPKVTPLTYISIDAIFPGNLSSIERNLCSNKYSMSYMILILGGCECGRYVRLAAMHC